MSRDAEYENMKRIVEALVKQLDSYLDELDIILIRIKRDPYSVRGYWGVDVVGSIARLQRLIDETARQVYKIFIEHTSKYYEDYKNEYQNTFLPFENSYSAFVSNLRSDAETFSLFLERFRQKTGRIRKNYVTDARRVIPTLTN